jgi:uncharacterized 2Fe-2S/4Fe-4S cluster protein (DUF4445 family)
MVLFPSMDPLIFHKTVILPPPSDDDRRAHDQRLRDSLGLDSLHIPLSLLRSVHSVIGARQELSCIIGRTVTGYTLIDIDRSRSYSIALDLGTTNLVALLYDNLAKKDVLTRSLENPQIEYGSDILTRMHHAMSGNGEDVFRVLRNGVNALIASLCRGAGINGRDIHGMAAAGNTVMTHFFLGLDISTIPVSPWVPVVRKPGFFAASELGLDMNPEASVYVFPNAGSYVGGDITSGIIATGMNDSDKPSILIDVGTNAEVVIGNREWMIVGAGAAGPALEEGISRIGKRAKKGIVHDVEIRDDVITCKTFDQAKPEGICGSGMVSLLYELYTAGIIEQTGVLTGKRQIMEINGEKAFALVCEDNAALYITQGEIQNFMRSKAAMFTLLLTLTRSVGVSFRDIERVFVSGALGTGIDARKAAGIGMMPAWPADIVEPRGNTSLEGCSKLLRDAGLAGIADQLVERITYKHMHDDPEFMKEFRGAVFIPHTNPGLLKI